MNLRLFAILSLALVGCAEDSPGDEAESSEATALVAPKGGASKDRRPAPPRSCDALQQQARTLLSGYDACTEDADCMIERVSAPCLAPFLCQVTIDRDSDVAQLTREANSLSMTYRRTCSDQCPVARCASPEALHAYCDRDTKRCRSELRLPTSDAGAPASDGPTGLDAGS